MRTLSVAALTLAIAMAPHAQAQNSSNDAIGAVAPALQEYTTNALNGDIWKRGQLSPRDRSIVTVASLIARNQSADMAAEFERALDNGVTPAELSETITHLAFYSGWGNATAAAKVAQQIYSERGIGADQLPKVSPEMLPLDEESESARATRVQEIYGSVSQGVVDKTTELLFRDLWLRPALAPRDRSLVTVSALISAGQGDAMAFHLNRAVDNGLTKDEASEVLTHLAFYAGWPNVFAAMPVAKDVFQKRSQ